MYGGDPEPFVALWSRRDPVSLFGAWGPCRTEWDELDRMFRWVAGRMSDGRNPAFDVTPADLLTAIVTERGVLRPPYTESIARLHD